MLVRHPLHPSSSERLHKPPTGPCSLHTNQPAFRLPPHLPHDLLTTFETMGSIISAIAGAIEAVISAIASVVMAIIGGIASVLIAIWDFLLCLICCDCFRGGRKRRVGKSRGGAY